MKNKTMIQSKRTFLLQVAKIMLEFIFRFLKLISDINIIVNLKAQRNIGPLSILDCFRKQSTVEPQYPDTRFLHHSAYHVSFSKSQFSVYDFNVNKLRILRH